MAEKDKRQDSMDINDTFWRSDVYQDAKALLSFRHLPLDSIKDDCIIVIDANVLLQPYEVDSKEAVNEIERVYGKLASEDRLIVPGQAVREYQNHRPRKIAAVVSKLEGAIERLKKLSIDRIPLLENIPSFQVIRGHVISARPYLTEAINGLQSEIDRLRTDTGGDRVSAIYREILAACVVDDKYDESARRQVSDEVDRRSRLEIAPGYKDNQKADQGVGDLLIWMVALAEGKKRNRDCIFVTMETKPDWWIRQNGAFQPRPELIEEYRQATGGRSVQLLQLSELLALFAAPTEVVTEVKQTEIRQEPVSDAASQLTRTLERLSDALLNTKRESFSLLDRIKEKEEIIRRRKSLFGTSNDIAMEQRRARVIARHEADLHDLYREQDVIRDRARELQHLQLMEVAKRSPDPDDLFD